MTGLSAVTSNKTFSHQDSDMDQKMWHIMCRAQIITTWGHKIVHWTIELKATSVPVVSNTSKAGLHTHVINILGTTGWCGRGRCPAPWPHFSRIPRLRAKQFVQTLNICIKCIYLGHEHQLQLLLIPNFAMLLGIFVVLSAYRMRIII